ncbi:hypothetical protein COHA_010443 [Chlorella ohadii]|uniref:Uncharacterized protein n=1 Tax=Chlorella ohadii TaxID=2649997 RepID=A0AAD5DGA4_9CHLO|nr:hypothetical protein COHA_010443 [Chlorella ohadii]
MSWAQRTSIVDQFSAAVSPRQREEGPQHKPLLDKVVVVGDCSTTVGSGIAYELLRQGATVVAPLRCAEHVEQLQRDCEGVPAASLHPLIADLSSEAGCTAFVNQVLERHGQINHGVSCFGSFWQGGQLTDQPLEEFSAMLHGPPTAHFLFAKHVLPALKQSPASSFLFVSEGAGKRMVHPDSSLFSVAASALYGIILAAQEQYADSLFRVNEMRLYAMLKRHGDIGNHQFRDHFGTKAYSHRKVGRLVSEALLTSKHAERIVVTPAMLDGATVTV